MIDVPGLLLSGLPNKVPTLVHGVLTLQARHEPGSQFHQKVKDAGLVSWWHPYTIKRSREVRAERWPEFRKDLDEIASLVTDKAILIHCAAGIHRTGCNGWAVLRRLGYTSEQAIEKVIVIRPESRDFVRFIPWAAEHLL